MTLESLAMLALCVWVLVLHICIHQLQGSVKDLYSSMLTMLDTQKSQQEIDASLLSMVQTLARKP